MRSLAILLALLSSVACASTEQRFAGSGIRSAVFDLGCSQEKIQVTVLARSRPAAGCAGDKVGVRGCGKQTTYICRNRSWVRESEVQSLSPPGH